MQGRRSKIEDFPDLLARFDAGESITNIAKSYRVSRDTIAKHLRSAGRVTGDLIEVQYKLKTRYRRKNFGPVSQETANLIHAIADKIDELPGDVIALAVKEMAKRLKLAMEQRRPCDYPRPVSPA